MSVFLKKILLFKASDVTNVSNITEFLNMTGSRGLEIKNNIMSFTLKNSQQSLDSNSVLVYKDVNSSGNIIFEEDDIIKVYLKYTEDFADIENSVWADNLTEPSSDDLRGSYNVTDLGVDESLASQPIKVTCVDRTFILFNRLFAKGFPKLAVSGTTDGVGSSKLIDSGASFLKTANVGMRVENTTDVTTSKINSIDSDTQLTLEDDIFTSGEGYELQWTSPSIFQKVIRFTTQSATGDFSGSGADAGVKYELDARLVSEGGLIQDSRKATYEDATANTDLVFPGKSLSKVWKPVYEWGDELSQIDFLNSSDELNALNSKKIVYGRKFITWIDEQNRVNWVETDDVVDSTVTIGTTRHVTKFSLKKSLFDVINFIVFRGGEDFYGKGTLDYVVDPSVSTKIKKMLVVAMTDIASNLIEKEIANGNLTEIQNGAFTYQGVDYDRNGTVTAEWNDTAYSTDATYNTALRDEIKARGKNRARAIISGRGNSRWKGSYETRGQLYTVGNLISLTNRKLGIVSEKIRIMTIQDVINKDGWFTTLQLEQDDEAIVSL